MRSALIMLLIAVRQDVPRRMRSDALLQAIRAGQAALGAELEPAPHMAPDGAVQLLRQALAYCADAGVPHSDIVAAVNSHNRRTAGQTIAGQPEQAE